MTATSPLPSRVPQVALLAARQGSPGPVVPQLALLVAYGPPPSRYSRVAGTAVLVAHSEENNTVPGTSQVAVLAAYATGVPDQSRSRAWSFALDGHTFYVLNLGPEGTFLYDIVTQQWCQFETNGYAQWNMVAGTMWQQGRVVAGDSISDLVWELDPSAVLDEDWREIQHAATGGISTRSRKFISCSSLRISASFGLLDDVNGTVFNLRFSDDQGQTWSDTFTVPLTEGEFDGEIAFRSLGSFMAPGRIFELTDTGGIIRIDGCDAFLGDFDGEAAGQQGG